MKDPEHQTVRGKGNLFFHHSISSHLVCTGMARGANQHKPTRKYPSEYSVHSISILDRSTA
jgi:hypothetical protein